MGALAFAGVGAGPVLLAVGGAAATLGGKFRIGEPMVLYAGLATLLAAAAWGVLRRGAPACRTGCAASTPVPATD